MAGVMTQYGKSYNSPTSTFVVDTESEIQFLPTTKDRGTNDFQNYGCCSMGSICIVGNKSDANVIIYMLFSFGWKKI